MFFRQLFDHDSSTYTYLLADERTREAVVIDPVFEQFDRDRSLIEELELALRYSLETHVHADHVTATALLRKRFGARSVISERAGVVCADLQVKHGDAIAFGRHRLEARETPGHTAGCLTYVSADPAIAFTGDALLIRGCGRTDFQDGDSASLYASVHEQILSLPEDTLLYPAHDYKGRTVTSVREERLHNPRLGAGRSQAEFVKLMAELALPYPRKIDAAVPANVRCGGTEASSQLMAATQLDTSWAPVGLTLVGVPELDADWLRDHADAVRAIDVRDPDEYRGELGHVPGAELVPLMTLTAASHELPRDKPLVLICRSGGRSGRAAVDLAQMGFARVASLRGGMMEWRQRGIAVEFGGPDGGSRQG